MIKKYGQKLNLKSNIYKQRSVSPITPQSKNRLRNYDQRAKNNQNEQKIYHNVCCPSCRYFFKVPLQPIIQQQKANSQKNAEKSAGKKIESVTAHTQTQRQFFLNKTSPKKENFSKKNESQASKSVSPDSVYPSFVNSKNKASMSNTPSGTPKKQIIKNAQSSYPNKSIYLSESFQSKQKIDQSNYSNTDHNDNFEITNQKFQTSPKYTPVKDLYANHTDRVEYDEPKRIKHQYIDRNSAYETFSLKKNKSLNEREVNELLEQIYLSSEIMQLLEYQSEMIESYGDRQIPGYYKLMLMQIQQKKRRAGRSEDQQQHLYDENID